jgi:hypothetical protein
MEADNTNFVGVPIFYNSKCVNNDPNTNVKETSVNVTTDLQYIIDNPDAIADEGFVIFCNYLDGTYFIKLGVGVLTDEILFNVDLSWANLENAYFRHERVLITGKMNNLVTDFWTAQKTIQQQCFAIVCPDDPLYTYDPSDEITTELGFTYLGDGTIPGNVPAKVKNSALNPNGEMNFNLLYGPPPTLPFTGVDNLFGIYGALTITTPIYLDTMNLDFTFTDPAPAGGINIRVREKVYDNLGALNCTGGWEVINFAVGTRTKSFSHLMCHDVTGGWCVVVEIEYAIADIDGISMTADPVSSCTPAFIYTPI